MSFYIWIDKLGGGVDVHAVKLDLGEVRTLQDILAKCASLHIDATQYACLKALILFRPGTCILTAI